MQKCQLVLSVIYWVVSHISLTAVMVHCKCLQGVTVIHRETLQSLTEKPCKGKPAIFIGRE